MAKKKSPEVQTHWQYYVECKSFETVTSEADPEEQWAQDSTSTDWTISNKLSLESSYDSMDYIAPFEVIPGETYYGVYAIYSDGDSFAHYSGKHLTLIELYKTESKAKDLLDVIQAHGLKYSRNTNGNFEYGFDYLDELGNKKRECASWLGWFTSLDNCTYEYFTLEEPKPKAKKGKSL